MPCTKIPTQFHKSWKNAELYKDENINNQDRHCYREHAGPTSCLNQISFDSGKYSNIPYFGSRTSFKSNKKNSCKVSNSWSMKSRTLQYSHSKFTFGHLPHSVLKPNMTVQYVNQVPSAESWHRLHLKLWSQDQTEPQRSLIQLFNSTWCVWPLMHTTFSVRRKGYFERVGKNNSSVPQRTNPISNIFTPYQWATTALKSSWQKEISSRLLMSWKIQFT